MPSQHVMNNQAARIARLANTELYDGGQIGSYVEGAPHIKHASLRHFYLDLAKRVYDNAARYNRFPHVLDLGAGEGSVTMSFLQWGATVTAVDISESQLETLRKKCRPFADRLHIRCGDVQHVLQTNGPRYDIVIANSFLHHIPDYLQLLSQAVNQLTMHGQFFSFQDPLRYDTLGTFTRTYSEIAYAWWRIFQGDLVSGTGRYLRRRLGIYREDCPEDNAEYHVVRGGVDQQAIQQLLKSEGFACEIVSYFSTQSPFFQHLGQWLAVKNAFAVIASRTARLAQAG